MVDHGLPDAERLEAIRKMHRRCDQRVIRLVPDRGMLVHRLPLRPGVDAELLIPRDLTPGEAARLCALIRTLTIEPAIHAGPGGK